MRKKSEPVLTSNLNAVFTAGWHIHMTITLFSGFCHKFMTIWRWKPWEKEEESKVDAIIIKVTVDVDELKRAL